MASPNLVTRQELVAITGRGLDTIRRWERNDTIPASVGVNTKGQKVFDLDEVLAALHQLVSDAAICPVCKVPPHVHQATDNPEHTVRYDHQAGCTMRALATIALHAGKTR